MNEIVQEVEIEEDAPNYPPYYLDAARCSARVSVKELINIVRVNAENQKNIKKCWKADSFAQNAQKARTATARAKTVLYIMVNEGKNISMYLYILIHNY